MNKLFWFITVVVFGYILVCKIVDWRANVNYKKEILNNQTTIEEASKIFANININESKVSNNEYQEANKPIKEGTLKIVNWPPEEREKIEKIYSSQEEAQKVINDEKADSVLKQIAISALAQVGAKGAVKGIIDQLKSGESFDDISNAVFNAYLLGCQTSQTNSLPISERVALVSELVKTFNWLEDIQKNNTVKKDDRWHEGFYVWYDRWEVCLSEFIKLKINVAKAIIPLGYDKIPGFDVTPFGKYIISMLDYYPFESAEALGDLGIVEAIPEMKRVAKKLKKQDEIAYNLVVYEIRRIRIKQLTHGKVDIGE